MSSKKPTVLFVCTHNSARSHMAEGWLRSRFGSRYIAASAGTQPGCVHPLAIAVMEEVGIDISSHQSKHVDTLVSTAPEYVVTVCDSAQQQCPTFPATVRTIHQSFPDPSRASGTHEDRLLLFRNVRDQIISWLDEFFGAP